MQFFLLLNEALNSLNRHLHRRGLSKDLLLFSRLNRHNISNGGAIAVEAMESYHHLHKIHLFFVKPRQNPGFLLTLGKNKLEFGLIIFYL